MSRHAIGTGALIVYITCAASVLLTVRTQAARGYAFSPLVVIFASVLLRAAISLSALWREQRIRDLANIWRLGAWRYAVPSVLYTVYDLFYFLVLEHADSVSWAALSNSSKLLLTALLVRRMLPRTAQIPPHYPSLGAAVIGSFLVEYDPAQTTLKHSMSFFVLFGIGMSINALAGVYQERLFKQQFSISINAQNFYVYCGMLITAAISHLMFDSSAAKTDLFRGFGWPVMIVIVGEALGGIAMSYVCKIYSTLTKVYGGCVVMCIVTLGSALFDETPLATHSAVGILLCCGSLIAYHSKAEPYQAKMHDKSTQYTTKDAKLIDV